MFYYQGGGKYNLKYFASHSITIGYNVVIDFFILSGFFLCLLEPYKIKSLYEFFKSNVLKIWPMLAVSFIPVLLIGKFDKYTDTMNLLFINNGLGVIKTSSSNPASWFVCVLIFVLPVFFIILRDLKENHKMGLLIFIAVFGLMIIGYPSSKHYDIRSVFIPILTNGEVAAFTSISLGVLFGYFIKSIKKEKPFVSSIWRKLFFTILELFLFIYYIYYLSFHKYSGETLYWVLIFLLILYLFIKKEGYFTKILDKKFSTFLGQFALPIYLMHFPMMAVMKKYLWIHNEINEFILFGISFLICLLAGVLEFYIVKLLKYMYKNFCNAKKGLE